MHTRREFLQRATLSGASLLLLPHLLSGCGSGANASFPAGDPTEALARSLRGQLLLPGAPEFSVVARPWNLRYQDRVPMAIARCASEADVAACINWAQTYGVPLVARSGGHSYAGYSTTTGLMIDVSPMKDALYDPATGQVQMAAGARNSTVYASLRPLSRALTHGRCLGVGVAGLVLGGGIGFNMRRYGLTCDQLLETRVVTADGQALVCNENTNADLFFAARGGGGGNFGIHTSFTFQTFPVARVTAFSITWGGSVDALFARAMELLYDAPRELGAKIAVRVNRVGGQNVLSLNLLGQWFGDAAGLRQLLGPLYALSAPTTDDVRELSYWEAADFLSDSGEPDFSHERSRYIFSQVSADGLAFILDRLRNWPGTGKTGQWKAFLMGGAVADVAPEATAYVHRQALMLSSVELEWLATDPAEEVARNEVWLADFHDRWQTYSSGQSYQNFIDDSQSNYLQAYYGENLARLIEVKQRHDPRNVFHYPQSIPLA